MSVTLLYLLLAFGCLDICFAQTLTPTVPTAVPDIVSPGCFDAVTDGRCAMWNRLGACKTHRNRMLDLCRRTCNFCEGVCDDFDNPTCRRLTSHYACITHAARMKNICPKSCGYCDKAPSPASCATSAFGCCWDGITEAQGLNGQGCRSCHNSLRLCRFFVDDCFAGSRNREFMRMNCPRACGLCAGGKGKFLKTKK